MPTTVNVIDCATEPLWHRGRFRTACHDLTELLGARVIGASVFDTEAGRSQGPYHFHDGVEEWMYVVSGAPVLRDPAGRRALAPGTLVGFCAGPGGAHTIDGPGRVVMFSVGARGWGEAFTSVYVDADAIGGKPGIRFRRSAAVSVWDEPAVDPVPAAPAGPCPQLDLGSVHAGDPSPARRLGTQTWRPALIELAAGEVGDAYRYDWCREHWVLVLDGAPALRRPDGEGVLAAGDIVCLPEGEAGAHQLRGPGRLLICSAPVSGPWASVYPDADEYVLRVPGQSGYRFRLADALGDAWDGEPGAGGEG